jgi:hypothetical protein
VSTKEEDRVSKSKLKDNGRNFFDSRGVHFEEFVPPGVTVNQKYYLEVVDRVRKSVVGVRM